jgi:hypothetical protein
MGPEERPKYPPEWFIVDPWLPRWLPRLPHRPCWLQWRWSYLGLVPVLILALLFGWYAHWGWRAFYVNHTGGTVGGDGPTMMQTDHSVYLIDEPLAITVTNRLSAPIYTQVTGPNNWFPCTIDLYDEWLSDTGRWINGGQWSSGRQFSPGVSWINSTLGFGAGCDRNRGCSGQGTSPLRPPLPGVLTIAPGGAYTQVWQPSVNQPVNQPGTYRIAFRYSTVPAAVQVASVGDPNLEAGATSVPDTVKILQMELQTALSYPVQIVDDGLRPTQPACHAV